MHSAALYDSRGIKAVCLCLAFLNIIPVSSIYLCMKNAGLILILFGAVFVIAGIFLYAGGNLSWLGKLPGDIRIVKPGYRIYFPITTCLLISIILSVLFYLIRMFR